MEKIELNSRFDILSNRAKTTLRNLDGLERSGDGAVIHRLRSWVSVLISCERNATYYLNNNNPTMSRKSMDAFEAYIDQADKWMVEVAKGTWVDK